MTSTTPRPSPLKPTEMAVAKLACDFTVRHLQAHGTDPGRIQTAALFSLQKVMVEMAFGYIPVRTYVGLPAGFGKTSAVAALIVALHAAREAFKNSAEVSVLVCAERVESLCTLKRDVLELASREGHLDGLAARLGLEHSYGRRASEPRTEDNDQRPFLLATHARMKASEGLRSITAFHGRPRSLVVWDEKLDVGSVTAFDFRKLSANLAAAIDQLQWGGPELTEACQWAKEAKEVINGAALSNPLEGAVVTLPPMDEDKRIRIFDALRDAVGGDMARGLLPMAGGRVRVNPRKDAFGCHGGVVKYIATIPDDLRRLVVLDASAEVSRLYAADSRIVGWLDLPGMESAATEFDPARIKDYSTVEIRFMQRGGGRSTVQTDAQGEASLIRDIVEVLKGVPEGEAALTFTYRPRPESKVDLTKTIQAAMKAAGLDPDEKLPGGLARFPFATWGQETSSNAWTYCRHVLLPGVYRVPFGVTLGQYLAARDSLAAEYPKAVEEDVVRGHLAGVIYQAASRGSCRSTTVDGKSRPMTLYLVDRDDGLRAEVSKLMPGARWVEWEGKYHRPKASTRAKTESATDRAFVKVLSYLSSRPHHVESISIKRIWQKIDPDTLTSEKVRKAAAERFTSPVDGWTRHGRSLVRLSLASSLQAEEARNEITKAASLFDVEASV